MYLEDLQLEEQADGVYGDGNNDASVEECTGEYCIFFASVCPGQISYVIYTISYACPLCRGGSGSFPLGRGAGHNTDHTHT